MAGLKGVFHRLPLEKKLGAKVDEFKRILKKSDGKVEYDWRDVEYIRTKNDYLDWKYKMGGDRNFDSSRPRRSGLKDCIDSFKRVAAVEEEIAVKTISKQVKSIFHSSHLIVLIPLLLLLNLVKSVVGGAEDLVHSRGVAARWTPAEGGGEEREPGRIGGAVTRPVQEAKARGEKIDDGSCLKPIQSTITLHYNTYAYCLSFVSLTYKYLYT